MQSTFDDETVSKINSFSVTSKMISQLKVGTTIEKDCIEAMFQLFHKRDNHINDSYRDVNSQNHNFEAYKLSLFCSPNILNYISDENINLENISNIQEWKNFQRIYIPIQLGNVGSNSWILVIIYIDESKVYYVNPMINESLSFQNIKHLLKLKLNQVLTQVSDNFNNFVFEVHPNLFFERMENDFDSAVYIVTILYYLVYNSPVYFKSTDMIKTRLNFAYWLLNESLPI
jgi:hypothetical protein